MKKFFNNSITKILCISLIICLSIPISSNNKANALETVSRSSLNIDETLTKDDNYYSNPEDILVVPIKLNKEFSLNESKWYQGIYYYIVDRLGLSDIPYHYLVTETGKVLMGNKFGDEKRTALTDFNSNSIIIGYLYKSSSSIIDLRAESALSEVILAAANSNNINPSRTSVRDLNFKRDRDTKKVEIVAEKSFGNWEGSVAKIASSITNFSPVQKDYSAEVLEVILPSEEVEPGSVVDVSLRLKNTSRYGNYPSANSELILTRLGNSASQFYINNIWLSQTQTPLMLESQTFLPNEETRFTFKIKAPIFVGEISENFELKTFSGGSIKSSNINLNLNIKRTSKQIIQIKDTGFSFVNVYSSPSSNSGVLRRVVPSERFFLISLNNETLWTNIDLGNGENGWLAAWNISYL